MKLPDLSKLGPEQIQAAIDTEVARLGLGPYVEYVRYVPQGLVPPDDATHVLGLTSLRSHEAITIAIKTKGLYGLLVDALLAIL